MLTNNLTAPLILIVEDDDQHAELIQRSFAADPEEYRLERVCTLASAKQAITRLTPGLILTDYRLPDGEGSELVTVSAGQWPVIIMTSQGNEELAVAVMKCGAQNYLVKSPESFAVLSHVIARDMKSWALIQERKRAEEAVRQGKREWERTFDALPDLIAIMDTEWTISRSNKAMAARCGLSVEEMIGRKCYELVHGLDAPPACCPGFELLESGAMHSIDIEEKGLGGSFDVTVSPLTNEDGRITSFVHIMRDITERKAAQEEKLALERQFQQAQKMESLGVLAGGIAHDFNNILAVILGNCSLVKQRPEMAVELVPEIEIAAERATDLCRQMLVYRGKTQFIPVPVKMTDLVGEMCKLLRPTIPHQVEILQNLENDLPSIHGDASQLRQIVMNLMINAAEALGENHGEISVALTRVELGRGRGEVDYLSKAISAGDYLCLKIADNGCGMDDVTSKRLFEPFYTTKFTGRGLGMPAVLGIITTHKGALQFSSQPGQGSSFLIYLPLHSPDFVGVAPMEVTAAKQEGGTILLVEDERQLREIAKALIEELGYTVIVAANGKEALELYQAGAREITLVVTDIDMPVMNGYELCKALKKINNALPIILSSGFGDQYDTTQITAETISGFLSKPYSFEQLGKALKGARVTDEGKDM
ncbi:MAG: hybrid sensor histidine kinase/response regulator [Deltaproteobacteria bacterium HGW-Deltaproteobacteria-4]|nr:MAG: hybrid sensor histidine kinase/response regulator [Deltaproteobacteria bacterium HGW-Deltaproteobacteria-4]